MALMSCVMIDLYVHESVSSVPFIATMIVCYFIPENEVVVVMDGSKYYESKILKGECFSKVWKYFVHYQGGLSLTDVILCIILAIPLTTSDILIAQDGSGHGIAGAHT